MKLTGPFTVDALYYRTVCSWLRGLCTPFSSEWSVRLSKRKWEGYFSADWTFIQLDTNTTIRIAKEPYHFFSQMTSSSQMPSREKKEETCNWTLTSGAHSRHVNNERTENTYYQSPGVSYSDFRPENFTQNASSELNAFWLSSSIFFRINIHLNLK